MDNSCALQYYYFQLGERNQIIEKIKFFLRSRRYLKIKPSHNNIYDVSLLESLKEFQRYKRLQITDGSFNDETYTALGSEMSESEIVAIRRVENATPVIDWLLSGKKGKPPTFYLQSRSPIETERSNGNPIDEETDRELAALFTKDGLVKAASVARGSDPSGNSHFRLADGKVYTIHIYGDEKGTKTTGVYLPKFFLPPKYTGSDTVIASTKTGEVLGIAHMRISSQAELDKNYGLSKLNDKGSRYIGEIAGTGGDGACYRHSHLHFYPNASSRNFIKILKSSFNDPKSNVTQYLLDVRELLER